MGLRRRLNKLKKYLCFQFSNFTEGKFTQKPLIEIQVWKTLKKSEFIETLVKDFCVITHFLCREVMED